MKKATGKEYIYCRCSRYTCEGHPRTRLNERDLDEQVVALLGRLRLSEVLQEWFRVRLRKWAQRTQQEGGRKTDQAERHRHGFRGRERLAADAYADAASGVQLYPFGVGLVGRSCDPRCKDFLKLSAADGALVFR